LEKYTPKHSVNVSGKMSETDAGIVGKLYAAAAVIAALAALLWAVRWW